MGACALQGVAGFLRKSVHEAAYGAGAKLRPGNLLECAVTSVTKDRRLATVSSDAKLIAGSVVKEWEGLDIGEAAMVFCLQYCRLPNWDSSDCYLITMTVVLDACSAEQGDAA